MLEPTSWARRCGCGGCTFLQSLFPIVFAIVINNSMSIIILLCGCLSLGYNDCSIPTTLEPEYHRAHDSSPEVSVP